MDGKTDHGLLAAFGDEITLCSLAAGSNASDNFHGLKCRKSLDVCFPWPGIAIRGEPEASSSATWEESAFSIG